jgi:ArsR family transcriptional regulator, arsenate/arsenite/antimonite-responsive transcriptional repressor / arsenate reductase (thioredoxin)
MVATTLPASPPSLLKLLAHELRWRLLEALARSDRRVQDLVALLGQPQNLVSYHLGRLRQQALVTERRSVADRRDVYYSLDLERLRGLYFATGEKLHPGIGAVPEGQRSAVAKAAQPRRRVLFLCTHNSARSQMAEGILRHLGGDAVEVWSAGTEPSRVHPLAIQAMEARGIDIRDQRSKAMDELLGDRFDYVITVCDRASEACPVFPGAPERIHWSIPDPAAVEGSDEARYQAFDAAAVDLTTRIRYLLALLGRRDD